ncbi:PLxRFG domain-containing protein [Psychrobacter faecalis]|uniref:PLxRFG domain-containing protein n=1 Tax=Psychrobacter faecalis TaxID=180588 RepID=UPI0028AC582A|nr:PLxRFG domain-containing protein [Psychrobacter faecalis]
MSLDKTLVGIAKSAVDAQRKSRDGRNVVSKGVDAVTNKSYANEDKKVAAAALRQWENSTWKPKVEAKLKQELKTRAPHLKPGSKAYQQTYDSLFNKNYKDLQSAKAKAQQQIGTLRQKGQTQRQVDNRYTQKESLRNNTAKVQSAASVGRDVAEEAAGALATGASRALRYPLQLAADVGENDDGGIFDRGAKALERHEDNLQQVYPAYVDTQQNGSFTEKLTLSAIEQIPNLALSFTGAGAAAKGAQLAGAGAKMTAATAYGTAAATMYPQAYGDGSDSTKQELENATPEQLATAVRSKDIYKGHFDKNIKAGMSEDEAYQKARDQTISSIAEESGDAVGLATLALSMLAPGVGSFTANRAAGGAVSKWGQKVFNTLAVKADAGKVAKVAIPAAVGTGIVGLNFAEEALQEGFTDKVAQQAAVDVGVKDKIDTAQTKEAMLMGGILGAAMGGGVYVGTRNSKLHQAQDDLKTAQQAYAEVAGQIPQLQQQIEEVSPRSPEGQALTARVEETRAALDAMAAEAEKAGIPRTSLARRAPRIDPTNSAASDFDGQVEGATELSEQDFENALNPDGTPAAQAPVVQPMSEAELDAQDAQLAELIAEQAALDEAIEDGSNEKPLEESIAAAQSWYDNKRGEGKQGLAGVVSRAAATEQDAAFDQQQESIKGATASINDYIASERAKQQQLDAEIEQDALAAKTEREKKEVEQRARQREIDRAQEDELLAKREQLAQPYENESFDTTVIGADGAPFNLARFWDSNMPAAAKAKAIADAFGGQVDQNVAKADWQSMPEGVQKELHQWFTERLDGVRQSREGTTEQTSEQVAAPAVEQPQEVAPTVNGLTMPVQQPVVEQAPIAPVEEQTPIAPVEVEQVAEIDSTPAATQLTDENPVINIPAPGTTKATDVPAPTVVATEQADKQQVYKSQPAARAAIKKQKLDPKMVDVMPTDGGFEIVPKPEPKPSYEQAQEQAANELGLSLDENGEYGGTDAEFETFAKRVDEIQGRSLSNSKPTPKQNTVVPTDDVTIGKDGLAKWFGSNDKAQAFIDKKGISDTHEVVSAGKSRFEIQPKAQTTGATNQTSTPTDVISENGSSVTQDLTATGKAPLQQDTAAPKKAPKELSDRAMVREMQKPTTNNGEVDYKSKLNLSEDQSLGRLIMSSGRVFDDAVVKSMDDKSVTLEATVNGKRGLHKGMSYQTVDAGISNTKSYAKQQAARQEVNNNDNSSPNASEANETADNAGASRAEERVSDRNAPKNSVARQTQARAGLDAPSVDQEVSPPKTYAQVQTEVANEMGITTNEDGKYDITDAQFDKMEGRVRERMEAQKNQAQPQAPVTKPETVAASPAKPPQSPVAKAETAPETKNAVAKTEPNPVEKPEPRKADKPTEPVVEIEDFGEKITGARKDMDSFYQREITDDEISNQPLSKIWPKKDIEVIEDKQTAALATVLRGTIPSKPRKGYKLNNWVAQVKNARGIMQQIMGDDTLVGQFIDKMTQVKGLQTTSYHAQLLNHIDRDSWSRVTAVDHRPYYTIKNDDGSLSQDMNFDVTIDKRRHVIPTENKQISEVVDKVNELLSGEVKAPTLKFDLYSRGRGDTKSWFITQTSDKDKTPLITFNDRDSARAFLKENNNELSELWEQHKEKVNVKKTDTRSRQNRERIGPDHRSGQDVTTEQFMKAFGLRGGQFGNWVKQGANSKDRQGMLNDAYDAFMDLAGVLGIPSEAIGLGGKLGMSFGARGKGSAMAHYEPSQVVINLTKTKGAGTLAHEWFHALDHHFTSFRDSPARNKSREDTYITYKPEPSMMYTPQKGRGYLISKPALEKRRANSNDPMYAAENWAPDPNHPAGVRPKVEEAFADLVNALNDSPMKDRATTIDKGATDGYWSRIIERAARAFESYVINKLDKQGVRSDFLANITPENAFPRNMDRYPYLLESEMAPVAEAFDNLFATIDSKASKDGNGKILFSRVGQMKQASESIKTNPTKGLTGTTSQQIIGALQKHFGKDAVAQLMKSGKLRVRTLSDFVSSDGRLLIPRDAEGFYHREKVVLIADNLTTDTAVATLLHELGGHAGIQSMLETQTYMSLMENFYSLVRSGNKYAVRAKERAEASTYSDSEARDEYIPYLITEYAQATERGGPLAVIKRFVNRVMAGVRAWVSANTGVQLKITPNDITQLAERMVKRLAEQSAIDMTVADVENIPAGQMQFSQESVQQANTPAFREWFDANNPDIHFSRRYSSLGTDGKPVTAKEKARDKVALAQATTMSSKFGINLLLRRHLATPQHVALLNPVFKIFTDNVQARIAYENNEAGLVQTYLPEIWDTRLVVGKKKEAMERVSKAIFDGTMADKVWDDNELQTMFDLTDKDINFYRRARQAIDGSVLNMTVDTLSALAKGTKLVSLPTVQRLKLAGLPPIGHNLMLQQHMTDELEKLAKGGLITPKAEARMQKQLDAVFDVMNAVAGKYDKLVEDGYAPLMRFGHYAVEVRDKVSNDLDLFELYETKGQQRKAIKELKERYDESQFTIGTGTLNPEGFKQFKDKGLSPETVQLFAAELGLDDDGAYQAYLKIAVSDRSALKRLIHRKKVPGYSEDMPRVLSSFVMSNARYSGRSLYNNEIERSIQNIEDGNLQNEAQKVFENMENPQEEFAQQRSLMFHYFMGFSPAFLFLNLTQPFTQTIPKLTAYVGAGKGHAYMAQALGIVSKNMGASAINMGKKATGLPTPNWKGFEDSLPAWVKKEDYLRMAREGHLDPQNIYMIKGLERGKGGVASGVWGNIEAAAGWPAEVSESINRRSTMIAAFRVAKDMGAAKLKAKGFDSDYDFAVSIIQQTQGIYNKANRSGLARGNGKLGQYGPLILVFKQFTINYTEQMIRHGRDKEVKSLAVAMMWQFALAGMLGLPFADDLRDIFEGIAYRVFGKAFNVPDYLEGLLGKSNADALMYGIASEKGRIDIFGRSSLGNVIPGTDVIRPGPTDWAEILGASSGFYESFFSAASMAADGKYKDALITASPRYIRDAASGAEIALTGSYRNTKGDKIMDLDKTDAVIKSMAFNPSNNARPGRDRSNAYQMKNMLKAKTDYFSKHLAEAIYQENDERVDELYNEMDAWNERNAEHFNVDIDKIEKSAEKRVERKDFGSAERQNIQDSLALRQEELAGT